MGDLYAILGVERDATESDIKSAYKKLIKVYHPDIPETGNLDRFQDVDTAYRVLNDRERRFKYDTHGWYDEKNLMGEDDLVRYAIIDLFNQTVKAGGISYSGKSVIDLMTEACRNQIAYYDQEITERKSKITHLEKLRDSIRRDDEKTNIFSAVAENYIKPHAQARDDAIGKREICELVIEELKHYTSIVEVAELITVMDMSSQMPSRGW